MPIKRLLLLANDFLFFMCVFRLPEEQDARGHSDLRREAVLGKQWESQFILLDGKGLKDLTQSLSSCLSKAQRDDC